MSRSRAEQRRVTVGSKVRVCVDHMKDVMADMELFDVKGNVLTDDVHMFGTVKSRTHNHYLINLPAAEDEFQFSKENILDDRWQF